MAEDGAHKIFVNLPVRDLHRSMEFFSKIGFDFDPRFTNDEAACMVVSDDAYVMLLTQPFFKRFTPKELCDTASETEDIVSLACDTRAEVDDILDRAIAAGGTPAMAPMDEPTMYGRSFYDPDGHHWEVFVMDEVPEA
jgi:predicted lactoylglutathione lyase